MQVSVIMGVYNSENEEAFCRSITSILCQTHEDFEFVICDDGSTDKTYSMLLKQAQTDGRIVLLRNEKNMGLGFTLNRCIKASKNEILVRQDIDDYSHKNRISELLNELEKNPKLSFIGSDIILYDINGEYSQKQYPPRPQRQDFLFSIPFMHGAVAMRKSAIVKAGGYDTSKRSLRCEDYELFMRMYSMGLVGGNISEPLYSYKEDSNSQRRRKYFYRFNEAAVRYKGFRRLKLMPKGLLYVIKPLVVGLIPQKLLMTLKAFYYT